MKSMVTPQQVLRALYYRCLHALSHVAPRDKTLWVFIGWRIGKEREIFSENLKYLFLYVHKHHKHIRPVWLGADREICKILTARGYEAYPRRSLRGVWYQLRSGYTFVGALMQMFEWALSGGGRVVQLWHGKSLKKTGFESSYSLARYNQYFFPHLFPDYHLFIGISPLLAEYTVRDFCVPEGRILVAGIPKHDALFHRIPGDDIDADAGLAAQIKRARSCNAKRVIFYGPTFRPSGVNSISVLNLPALNDLLAETNDYLIVGLHPKFSSRDWIPNQVLSHISFVQGEYDNYPVVHGIDLLITDYSALAMDFLLMGKPTIHFAYDLDEYKESMGIYEELWNLMPGPKVFTQEELHVILKADLRSYTEKIPAARTAVFGAYTDGKASERIVAHLLRADA